MGNVMVIRKSWLISLCLIFGLSQMPAAHAQLVQLIAAVVKVLPKLLRGNQGNRASQGDPWTGNGKHIPSQSANTDAQSSGSHSGDTNDKESNSKPKSEDDLTSSPPAVQDSPKIFVNTTERQIT